MESKVGVKETLEVLDAVKVMIITFRKVMGDGKINMGDVGVIFDVIRQLPVLNAGVDGAEMVPVEFKDLDQAEVEMLVAKALELGALFGIKA